VILGAGLLIARYFDNKVIDPIHGIISVLNQINQGATKAHNKTISTLEINELGEGINKLAEQLTQIKSEMNQKT